MPKWLTVQQKYEVLVHHKRFPKLSLEKLAAWAQREFQLAKAPSRNTIASLLKASDAIEDMQRKGLSGKRRRSPVQCPQLETQLTQFVENCKRDEVFLNRRLLTEKAAQILQSIPEAPAMRLSDGWLTRFLKRQQLGFQDTNGPNPENFTPLAEVEPEQEEEEPEATARTRVIARVYGTQRRPGRSEREGERQESCVAAGEDIQEMSSSSGDDIQERRSVETVAPVPVASEYWPSQKLIAAMVDAGALKEEVEGANCIVRIEGVHSEAWKLFLSWACSPGVVGPLVQAVFAPTPEIQRSQLCPPDTIGINIQKEVNSIIHHMAHLSIRDFADGIPSLPGALLAPPRLTNVRDAKVAVIGLLPAISNPGEKFPVIDVLRGGLYICNVDYSWRGIVITVPIIRLRY